MLNTGVLVGKPKIMIIQSCRGCAIEINTGILVGKPKIMAIQSCRGCECLILRGTGGKTLDHGDPEL